MLWLWYRPADTVLTQPLARKLPYAVSAALKKKPRKRRKFISDFKANAFIIFGRRDHILGLYVSAYSVKIKYSID